MRAALPHAAGLSAMLPYMPFIKDNVHAGRSQGQRDNVGVVSTDFRVFVLAIGRADPHHCSRIATRDKAYRLAAGHLLLPGPEAVILSSHHLGMALLVLEIASARCK